MVKQLSLFDEDRKASDLASAMQLVRSSMNRVAREQEGAVSRDHIADRMTDLASVAGVSLAKGRTKRVTREILDKWLTPSDQGHPPSLLAVLAFCQITEDNSPILPLVNALGCSLMTEEDRRLRDYARAIISERNARRKKKKLEAEL